MEAEGSNSDVCSEVLAVSQAINYLGFHLYKELAKEKSNVFFSPLSLSSALSMLFCGTKNETAKEMRQVLGYETTDIVDENVSRCFQLLHTALDETPDSYTLTSANVLFGQQNFLIKDEFKKLLEESFRAMTLEVDFLNESSKAVQQANDWVKEKTNGMIPKLLNSLDPATVMVILNAVYFKGFWMHQFKERSTYKQNFFNKGLESNAKEVEMMHLKESFPFVEKGSFKALQLPYKGEEVSMMILLPNNRTGLEELESNLSSTFIKDLKSQFFTRDVKVALPKFRLEYLKSMKSYFQNIGLNDIFCPGANFEGISDSKELVVSDIVHKAVLIVNEEGSEAAAATAVVMMLCSISFDPEFIVDHPFLFLIYNSKTDLILFMGRVDEL